MGFTERVTRWYEAKKGEIGGDKALFKLAQVAGVSSPTARRYMKGEKKPNRNVEKAIIEAIRKDGF